MERLRALVLQHVDNEHLGYMGPALEDEGVEVMVWNFAQRPNLPSAFNPKLYDFLIILGGPVGVNDKYDDFPAKEVEMRTVKRAIFDKEFKRPVFGICLGSQLIASALRAEVYQNKYDGQFKKEIGYYSVPLTEEGKQDPLFAGLESPMNVLQWHGDAFSIPKGATRLATSSYCENQAFVYKENGALAYGVLFHTEFTPEMVRQQIINDRRWIHDVKDPRDDVDENFLIEWADKNAAIMEKETKILIRNWVNMIRERQSVPAA